MQQYHLPINAVIDDLALALKNNACAVLQAAPGAGKTTCVPLALLNESWLEGRKIIMLAPRRLAARAAAMRMADLLNEKVGQTVGYRVRMDSRVSSSTRIEVVTEGVLTRMLQSDSSLEGIALVIFDEFHERNLDADLGLALCRDMQGILNPALRLLVMSATMETGPVSSLLENAPVISCPGREYPVETRYAGRHTPSNAPEELLNTLLSVARSESGSILVFLPGAREIRWLEKRLAQSLSELEWIIAPLFGNLTRRDQDQAISPPSAGKKKIVLATSIAETSLTIEGIRVVVDSGLQRLPRFDARSGLTRLVTVPVSRASADQRRGRAGRLGPGVCIRMWSRETDHTLVAAHRPEILEADLTRLVLELAIWGVNHPKYLCWLDPPPDIAFNNACELLLSLGALYGDKKVTEHGRKMAELPLHPRLAHMIVSGEEMGLGGAACDLAALISERDIVRFDSGHIDVDIQTRVDLLQDYRHGRQPVNSIASVNTYAVKRIIRVADHLRRRMGCGGNEVTSANSTGQLLAWAYPDRVAHGRPGFKGKFLLSNGRGAYLDPALPLAREPVIIAAELDGQKREARIFKAAAYRLETLIEQFADQVRWEETVDWDSSRQAVSPRRELKFGSLILRSERLTTLDQQQAADAMIQGILRNGLNCLPWTRKLRHWQHRVCFLRRILEDAEKWPDVSDKGLESTLRIWITPWIDGIIRLKDLKNIDLQGALFNLLSYPQHKSLNEMAPTHLTVPSGSRVPIDYSVEVPVLAVRLQEMFGLQQTPAVAGGRQPLLIHLLSPASRPVQITQDLAGFWENGYPEVKKELKGRYPKHYWPDDPMQAVATSRVKPIKKL